MRKTLLTEGPVGHMAHPYENLTLTFDQLKGLFKHITDGFPDVEVSEKDGTKSVNSSKITEKLDGQNIIVTFDHDTGKALIIRRMAEHAEKGGIDKETTYKFFTQDKIDASRELIKKKALQQGKTEEEAEQMANKGSAGAAITHVAEAFYDAMKEFEKAASKVPRELFMTDNGCRIFYNGEVVDPRTRNIVDYDTQDLVLHRTKHAMLCPDANRLQSLDNKTSEMYSEFLEKQIQMISLEDEQDELKVKINPLLNFDNLVVDDEIYEKAATAIDNLITSIAQEKGEGPQLTSSSTIQDFLEKVIDETLASKLQGINSQILKKIRDVVLMVAIERKNPTIRNHIKPIVELLSTNEQKQIVTAFLRNPKAIGEMIKQAVKPIEYIVHNFAVEYLQAIEAMRSLIDITKEPRQGYINDPKTALSSLRKKVGSKVTDIVSSGVEKDITTLRAQVQKIINNPEVDIEDVLLDRNLVGIYDKISSTIEGLVFTYAGQEYKITGQFAPINQLMGLGRFSRPGKRDDDMLSELPSPATYEGVELSEEKKPPKRIAIFSGGFKPPHIGHYLASKYLADKAEATDLYILIGSSERYSKDGSVTIGPKESEIIWKTYYGSAEGINFDVQIIKLGEQDIPSPVKWVYTQLEDNNFENAEIFCGIGAQQGTDPKDKIPEDKRWLSMVKKYENANQIIIPLQGGSIRGSIMRELLATDDDRFLEFLPSHMSQQQKIRLRSFLTNKEYLKESKFQKKMRKRLKKQIAKLLDGGRKDLTKYGGAFTKPRQKISNAFLAEEEIYTNTLGDKKSEKHK